MSDFKNKIQLGIQIDPKNKSQEELNSIIKKLNENKINLDLTIKGDASKQLESLSVLIDTLKSKMGGEISLGNLDKAINNSMNGLSKLNGELQKVSQTNYGNGNKKIITETATAIGEIVTQTKKLDEKNNVIGDGVAKTTTNYLAQANAIKDIEKAQERLNALTLINKNKVEELKGVFSNISENNLKGYSGNELTNYLNQVKELENEENRLKQIQKEELDLINQMANGREKAEIASKRNDRSQELSQTKAINQALKDNYEASLKEAEAQKQVQQEIEKQIKLLEIQKQALTRQYWNKIDTSYIDDAISKLKSMDSINMKDLRNEISNIGIGIKDITEQARASEGIFSKFGSSLRNIGVYFDVGDIFRSFINGAKEAVQYTMSVENAMIDLRRVIDMSDENAQAFQNSMHNLSVQLASSNSDTISTVATFSKLGYSIQDATKLGEITTKYNFAADINNINDSANGLIATLKGFNLESSEASRVVDEINTISNKYAVTATDINTALQKSSATLSTFGNSLEESIAMNSAIVEITRNSSQAGNALKSISARLTTNSSALKELDKMGISIEDTNGNLKSTYQLFVEISDKIKDLKGEELAQSANGLFGKQNISSALALTQNIEQAKNILNDTKNSIGSVDKEFGRYLDSTKAKISQLKENLGGLYSQFIDSNMTKGIVDGLNAFVTVSTSVISKLGAMPTIITSVVGALSLFNSKFRESMTAYQPTTLTNWISKLREMSSTYINSANTQRQNIESIKNYITAQKEAGVNVTALQGKLAGMQAELARTTLAEKACALGAEVLGTAFNMALGLGISYVISKVVELGDNMINAQEKLSAFNKEFASTAQSSDFSKALSGKELLSQYEELEAKLSTLKAGTSEYKEVEQQLANVQSNLISLYPQSASAIDGQTNAKKLNLEETKKLIEADDKLAQSKAIQALSKNDLSGTSDVEKLVESYKKAKEEMDRITEDYNNGVKNEEVVRMGANGPRKTSVNTAKALEDATGEFEKYKTAMSAVQPALSVLNKDNKAFDGALDSVNEALGINTQKTNENTNAKLKNNTIDISDVDEEANVEQEKANAIAEATEEYSKSTQIIAQAQGYIDRLNKAQAVTPTLAKQIAKAYPEIGENINSIASAQDFLNSKIQEQVVSQQEAYEIMMGDDQSFYENKIKNNQSFQDAYNGLMNSFITDGSEAYSIDFNNYKTLNELKQGTQSDLGVAINQWLSQFVDTSAQGYGIDLSNFASMAQAKAEILRQLQSEIAKINQQMAGAIEYAQTYNNMLSSGDFSDPNSATEYEASARASGAEIQIDSLKSKLGELNGAYEEVNTNFDKFGASMQGFSGGLGGGSDFSGTGGSGGSGGGKGKDTSASDAKKAEKELIDSEKKMITDISDTYEDAETLIGMNVDSINATLEELGDNATNQDKVNALTDEIKQQANLLESAKDQMSQLEGVSVTTEDAQEELQKAIKSANSDIKDQESVIRKLKSELRDLAEEEIEKLIEKEKELAEASLEFNQKQDTKKLEEDTYKFSADEWSKYRKSRKKDIKDEIESLEDLQDSGMDETTVLEAINQKKEELNDLDNESYKTIKDTQKAYEEMMEQRKADIQDEINSIDAKISAMEEEREAEEQAEELAEKKLAIEEAKADLTEKQIALEKLKNQKTIQNFQQQEDGTWQFTYVSDQDTLDSAQEDVDNAQSTLDDAKQDLKDYKEEQAYQKELEALQDQQEVLQDQMDAIDELTETKSQAYEEDLQNIETYYSDEKEKLDKHYDDMEKLVDERFEKLKQTYGDNWTEMITSVETSLKEAQTQLDELTKIDLTYKVDVSSGVSSSDGSNSSSSSSSNAITDVVKSQFDDVKEYGYKILEQKQIDDSNMLTEQENYQKESIESSTDFLTQQNDLHNTMLEVLQNIWDWRWGNLVEISNLSTEKILDLIKIASEAITSADDPDKIDDVIDEYNDYVSTSLADYVSDKADLYDMSKSSLYARATASLLDTTDYLNNNGYSTGTSSSATTTTSNSSGVNNYYINGDINLPNIKNGDDAESFFNGIVKIAKQKNNVKS